ncbi:MAG TPA: tRNA 5-methoxyuridine(34)/uridine 5-oxyacetic acid(34) synthase CmoB [Campylobacterales bacterium]|nr:tRNA 5-methoxyuridine(34)/uridine 5-oxyacetic acid(34) synthase CmoB [Campylobacterales bacterium]
MDIALLKKEREKWLTWKDIKPLREALETLESCEASIMIEDTIMIDADISQEKKEEIDKIARMMKPWRKGPFKVFDTFIDSEWNSAIKYNLLKPYFNLKDKCVADIGCNNGYYMFRMLEQNPTKIVGFDPSPLCLTQFDFINHFVKSDIQYELLGIEHLEFYKEKFDTIFCLGVLYHRPDPVGALKSLKKGLNKGGELFLDTFMIDGEEEIALTPNKTYSKIPNIYFVPTIPALKNWCLRAGFKEFEVLEIKKTLADEQRKTEWIPGQSLDNFLDKNDPNYTVEGYPAPKRVYIRARV